MERRLLKNIRGLSLFFIISLVISGLTAFPLTWELDILCKIFSISPTASPDTYGGLQHWIAYVNQGLSETSIKFPFLAYGTDWLAFSHLIIAFAFIGVYLKPIRNIWIVYFGMVVCVGIFPLAFICGYVRGIPFYWQLIDCSFGLFGLMVLLILHKHIKKLEIFSGKQEYKY